jgi:hypothetical protein
VLAICAALALAALLGVAALIDRRMQAVAAAASQVLGLSRCLIVIVA